MLRDKTCTYLQYFNDTLLVICYVYRFEYFTIFATTQLANYLVVVLLPGRMTTLKEIFVNYTETKNVQRLRNVLYPLQFPTFTS